MQATMESLVSEIRRVEAESTEIAAQAEQDAAKLIADARVKAQKLAAKAEVDLFKARESTLRAEEKNSLSAHEKELAKSAELVADLKTSAGKKEKDAVEFVLKKINEMVG
jgi:vacuolar-type H+-ATPase subunit H